MNFPRQLRFLPFRSFGLASVYSFLSAILTGLSMNLFVSVRLTKELENARTPLYIAAITLVVSAVGFFSIAWNLEDARAQWIEEGAVNSDAALVRPIRTRLHKLYVSMGIALAGATVSFILIALS